MMKVKKYTAASMPEAMKKIRAELGEQAVLLQSKTVYSGGVFGLFKRKMIEVVAAVDPNPPVVSRLKEGKGETAASLPSRHIPQQKKETSSEEALRKELTELKEVVKQFSLRSELPLDTYPEELQSPILTLKVQGIANHLLEEVKLFLLDKWKEARGHISEERANEWAKEWLVEKIKPFQNGQPALPKKFINVIGLTGVGKTTTLAKMAAKSVLEKKFTIAFITSDTYRIAAIEQLKTYADLLKVPVEVAYKPADIKQAIEKFKHYDLVYIDTAGRNYLETSFIKELKTMIPFEKTNNYLVISLTAKEQDTYAVINQFSVVPIHQFIFTKLDETTSRGMMINIICQYGKGAAFLTNGQNVPDDLIEPDAETIADMILGGHV